MPTKAGTERPSHTSSPSPFSTITEWARQGTETFFATQRILLDLVIRQNANTTNVLREHLSEARKTPLKVLTEVAGEGASNLIAAERILLHLAQRENEIVLGAIQDRASGIPRASAVASLVRRSIDTLVDMQMHFLTLAAKQADAWVDSAKSGKAYDVKPVPELVRESMETFVRSQKKFLDVVAEETANLTDGTPPEALEERKTELTELAREATEAFIDAQKKVLDVYAQQGTINLNAARTIMDALNPFQPAIMSELSKRTVENLVGAENALLQVIAKPPHAKAHETHHAKAKTPHKKRPASARARATSATA